MPDVYATIASVDLATQERLARLLELRAGDARQRAIVDAYLGEIDFPAAAAVLEVGCGTGFVTGLLAERSPAGRVVGIDPSPVFIAKARELAAPLRHVDFHEGDGRALPFPDEQFDVVVFHTTLTHVPEPERALAEARRVLRPGATIAVCDGDYSTMSVAVGEHDPLQACVEAAKAAYINDVWLARRLPTLIRRAGFADAAVRSHGYVQTSDPEYMTTLVDRGADALAGAGRIAAPLQDALKAEARRRAEAGAFYGFINFVSCLARRPG